MANPRIIRALELIHEAKTVLVNPHNEWPRIRPSLMLSEAEDELLRHMAELKREENAKVPA